MLRRGVLVCGATFLLCFSIVPLYRIACERVFGIKLDETAIDAGEAARWMLHCHHMPHLSTGMMTEFAVSA